MAYLHQNSIVHGDVHAGNVLLFSEEGEYLAKWADFGLGIVGSDKQYQFRDSRQKSFNDNVIQDIFYLGAVFIAILRDRQWCRPETQEEKKALEEFNEMIKQIRSRKLPSLRQVYEQYKHILEDELILDEHHLK